MRVYVLLLVLTFSLFSCQKKQENRNEEPLPKPNASVQKNYVITDRIKAEFRQDIEDWETYRSVSNFFTRFRKVSANEVLSNAIELEGLVKQLKDSVKPGDLSSPALNARINILYNETLRLSDMTDIPAITAQEIHQQTDKVIKAYASLNAKINTILLKRKFQEEITIDADFVGLDTTKMDSISRQTLLQNELKIPDPKE